jgi:hypothetical protein
VQERAGSTLAAIGIGKDFLSRPKGAQHPRERIDKCDYMKLNNFCTTKEMISRLKRQPIEREKIFARYTSDKGLVTEYIGSSKTKLPETQ